MFKKGDRVIYKTGGVEGVFTGKMHDIDSRQLIIKWDMGIFDGLCLGAFAEELELVQDRKKSNLIEIDYVEIPDGQVKILAIRNLLDAKKGKAKYGERVWNEYMNDDPLIWAAPGIAHLFTDCGSKFDIRSLPFIMPKSLFIEMQAYMKAAGARLCSIAEGAKQTIKTVKI